MQDKSYIAALMTAPSGKGDMSIREALVQAIPRFQAIMRDIVRLWNRLLRWAASLADTDALAFFFAGRSSYAWLKSFFGKKRFRHLMRSYMSMTTRAERRRLAMMRAKQ